LKSDTILLSRVTAGGGRFQPTVSPTSNHMANICHWSETIDSSSIPSQVGHIKDSKFDIRGFPTWC